MYSVRRVLRCMVQQLRHFSSATSQENVVAEPLEERGILRLSGPETCGYLQGLITNDVSHLETGPGAMYTMFLNSKGRVMYDAILYRTSEPHTLYVECDSSALPGLERHLKTFRLRKKITIDPMTDLKIWAVYSPSPESSNLSLINNIKSRLVGENLLCNEVAKSLKSSRENISFGSILSCGNVMIFTDPRIAELGLRVVCPLSEDVSNMLKLEKSNHYCSLRYRLGVGEGVNDLPPDNCFPLEANCDYMHGVSFHKGCYIGQELTARTHHTGVVRKRLMPISLESQVNISNASKQEILNEQQKVVGKVRGLDGTVGLGLLRISEALSAQTLSLGNTTVHTKRPSWWPKEAPKELESKGKL